MSMRNGQMTIMNRFRRATSLRWVFIITAVLASQNFLACAFENATATQGSELAASLADSQGNADECCSLCLDCANCGGCHASALGPRSAHSHQLDTFFYSATSHDTAAPTLWTPPTLLRPPIAAA